MLQGLYLRPEVRPMAGAGSPVRPFVRSIIERFRPSTIVMSQNEIHPRVKIKTLGQI
jgi:flagellar biosynthesis protein FlhA